MTAGGAARQRGLRLVRYDDMLSTVLAQPLRDAGARVRLWRQLIDLLAQGRDADAPAAVVDHAFHALRTVRGEVPVATRIGAAEACVGRTTTARLAHFFTEDVPEVAGPLLARVQLDAADWRLILPLLSPFALGQLRARSDLPEDVAYRLGIAGDAAARDDELDQMIAQAEARRALPTARTPAVPSPPPPAATTAVRSDSFGFVVDAAGMLQLRGPGPADVAGVSIAQVAAQPDHGVDGHAAGAWRRREAFTDARLLIAGDGPGAGQWRISAEPCFAAPDGRFVGYAGEARRPREQQAAAGSALADAVLAAAPPDRERAARLMAALRGPLDLAGRLPPPPPLVSEPRQAVVQVLHRLADAEAASHTDQRLDAASVLTRLHAACQLGSDARGVRLSFRIAAGLSPIAADPLAVERMFARLLAAAIGIARRGECVAVRVGLDRRDGSLLSFTLSRPGALAGLDEPALLAPEGADGPRVALSFAIRLVRSLAMDAGGRLDIAADRLVLTLPLVSVAPTVAEERRG